MLRFIFTFVLMVAAVSAAAESEFTRKPWTSSRVQGSPDPPKPYVAEQVFEELSIAHGLEMIPLDGRLWVLTRKGMIYSFVEKEDTTQLDVFADLKAHQEKLGHAYGMVLHPNWRENHTIFVSYTVSGVDPEEGTRVSRFTFEPGDVPKLNVESEEVVYTWRSGGHNGANLQFGPDGMLYISTGDATEPSPPDKLNTGQDNSDVLAAVLRIDVDTENGFRIPPDNPFVGRENVRPEIWAFGFRNPWKMSFDSKGRLWLGDVGWELWEMIHLVEKGGNYGWSAMEATQPIKPETASDLAPISLPAAAHAHTEAASITGGYEYVGERLPQLQGAYVYGDYETGKIWALRHDGTKPGLPEEIADTPHRISTFGVGNAGNLYYIHYDDPSSIFRLSPNPAVGKPNEFPRKLSETGLFSDVAQQLPNDGVYEFQIHEPMWQDGAETTRYIALPDNGEVHTTIEQDGRKITTTWPEGAVLAKTISLKEAPVETQMLHFDGNQWNAFSYRWNEAATDAEVVEANGIEFEVKPNLWKGGATYRIASRAECMRCHNMWNKFTPAFEPMQLAGFAEFPEQPAREVAVGLGLTNANFFAKNQLGELASSRGRGSVERKARSWLHANCAHCHRRHGGGSTPMEVNFERELSATATLFQKPTRGDFGLDDAHVFTPGAPWRSVLNYRVSALGPAHMPPIGAREIDERGVQLLSTWIAGLPNQTDPDFPEITEFDPQLLDSTSSAMRLADAIATRKIKGAEAKKATDFGLASTNQNIRALFERFRPPSQRPAPKTLDPAQILTLTGDPKNGESLLSLTGKLAACFACHQIDDAGVQVGPDLTGIGARLNREQLLESLLDPSKTIAPEFQVWIAETKNGETISGFVSERSETETTLRLATGQLRTLSTDEIKSMKPQTISLMPEGLLNFLTSQEVADLLAWLETVR